MISANLLSRLSRPQRDMLIDHIDKQCPVNVQEPRVFITIQFLVNNRLLRYDDPQSPRPKYTELTNDGREAVCHILGDCADVLVRAGYSQKLKHRPLQLVATEIPNPPERLFWHEQQNGRWL